MKLFLLCLLAALSLVIGQECTGEWQEGTCTQSCGGGVAVDTCGTSELTKTRTCNPESCDTVTCPSWEDGTCSASCGGGVLTQTCSSTSETQTASCNTEDCTRDIETWEDGTCSASCGGGVMVQTSSTTSETRTAACNTEDCTRDIETWEDGTCSSSCGGGVMVQTSSTTSQTRTAACNEEPCGTTCDTITTPDCPENFKRINDPSYEPCKSSSSCIQDCCVPKEFDNPDVVVDTEVTDEEIIARLKDKSFNSTTISKTGKFIEMRIVRGTIPQPMGESGRSILFIDNMGHGVVKMMVLMLPADDSQSINIDSVPLPNELSKIATDVIYITRWDKDDNEVHDASITFYVCPKPLIEPFRVYRIDEGKLTDIVSLGGSVRVIGAIPHLAADCDSWVEVVSMTTSSFVGVVETEWVDGTCSASCGGGVMTQTSSTTSETRTAACNEAPCGDCWEDGTCSASCGGGVLTQTCSTTLETRTAACNEEPCSDCTWEDGTCSASCGGGVLTQTCGTTLETRTAACNEEPCECDEEWKMDQPCSESCGGGVLIEKRCEETRTKSCNTDSCVIFDCEGEWIPGPCSDSCGTGVLVSAWHITSAGHGCQYYEGETRTEICNTEFCADSHCEGHWELGTECSTSCGGGVVIDKFVITTPQSGSGFPCNFAEGETATRTCNTQICAICGNGIVEWSEDCDSPGAKCCTDKCKFEPKSKLCRVARTQCWADSYCTERHAACPRLHPKKDGTKCNDGISYSHNDVCHRGRCYGVGKHLPVPDHVRVRWREVSTTSASSLYKRNRQARI